MKCHKCELGIIDPTPGSLEERTRDCILGLGGLRGVIAVIADAYKKIELLESAIKIQEDREALRVKLDDERKKLHAVINLRIRRAGEGSDS